MRKTPRSGSFRRWAVCAIEGKKAFLDGRQTEDQV